MSKLRLFFSLSSRRKLLLVATLGLSFYSFLMMLFFKKNARFASKKNTHQNLDTSLITDIRWAIFIVDKYVPWQNVCRHQAYQAKILFSHYGIPYEIFVGFKKNEDGKIDGHAWTMASGLMITGFCNPAEYIVQAVYS